MAASDESLWHRIGRMNRIRTMVEHTTSYYYAILQKCARHAEDLYDKRILRRYGYNDVIKLIRTANEEISRLFSSTLSHYRSEGFGVI